MGSTNQRDRREQMETLIIRDKYGCLHPQHRDDYTRERGSLEWQWDAALARVRECKSLPQEYDSISWDHRGRADGGATHHDIMDYDLTSVVVCVRETEGGRYGVKTTCKTYYYISEGEGTETTEPISRLAKTNPPLGSICARLRGEPNGVKLTTTRETYKQMALVDGQMRSIYDGSPWDIGVERREAARRDHNGGLYVYASRARAEKAEYPTSSKLLDAPRVVVRCEARGIHTNYDNGKMAYSSVTPLEIVR